MSRTLHVIMVAFHRVIPLRIMIDCFLVQDCPDWKLHIIHDGPAPQEVRDVINLYHDPRIDYIETPAVNGSWGHPNRGMGLKKLSLNHRDYVLLTNDDNYYVPFFVRKMLTRANGVAGMVYCDTVHSYSGYDILRTELRENHIDMGSFIVRVDIAKRVGFTDTHFSADGAYAVKCSEYSMKRRMPCFHLASPLFIHN